MNNLWLSIHDFVYVIKTIMGVSSITWAYLYFKDFIASLLNNLLNLTVTNMSYEWIKLLPEPWEYKHGMQKIGKEI